MLASQSSSLIATSYEIVFLAKADSSTDVAAAAAATHIYHIYVRIFVALEALWRN